MDTDHHEENNIDDRTGENDGPVASVSGCSSSSSSSSSKTQVPNGKSEPQMQILEKKGYRIKTVQYSDVAGIESDTDSNKETFCCGLCCFSGCVYVAIGSVYFFIILPACIVLIFHGANNDNSITLGLGISILLIFVLLIPCSCLIVKRCRRNCRKRKEMYVINAKNNNNGPTEKKDFDGPQANGNPDV